MCRRHGIQFEAQELISIALGGGRGLGEEGVYKNRLCRGFFLLYSGYIHTNLWARYQGVLEFVGCGGLLELIWVWDFLIYLERGLVGMVL